MEKEKQNAAVSDLSKILVELKTMAVDMGSEIDRFVWRYTTFFQLIL